MGNPAKEQEFARAKINTPKRTETLERSEAIEDGSHPTTEATRRQEGEATMSCVCACVCVCMCVSVFSPLSHFFTLPPLLSLSPSPLLQTDVWGQTKVVDKDLSKYPTALSFYLQPPQEEIGLEEFEELAVARLHCECVCVCLCDCVHCTSLSSARLFFLKRWNHPHP